MLLREVIRTAISARQRRPAPVGADKTFMAGERRVYGYRKIHDDLHEVGEACGRHRLARLMSIEGLRSQTGYRRRPRKYGGKPTVASPNLLKRQFDVVEPNKVWVTDIT